MFGSGGRKLQNVCPNNRRALRHCDKINEILWAKVDTVHTHRLHNLPYLLEPRLPVCNPEETCLFQTCINRFPLFICWFFFFPSACNYKDGRRIAAMAASSHAWLESWTSSWVCIWQDLVQRIRWGADGLMCLSPFVRPIWVKHLNLFSFR